MAFVSLVPEGKPKKDTKKGLAANEGELSSDYTNHKHIFTSGPSPWPVLCFLSTLFLHCVSC